MVIFKPCALESAQNNCTQFETPCIPQSLFLQAYSEQIYRQWFPELLVFLSDPLIYRKLTAERAIDFESQ